MEAAGLIIPAFVAGLLTFLAPCTLPMVPAYVGFISGTSAKEALKPESRLRQRIFLNGLSFVLGFSVVFVFFGVFAGLAGSLFPGYRIWLSRVGGAFVVLFGLFMLGALRIPAFAKEWRPRLASPKPGGYGSAFLLGAAFGTGWTPCIGPVLGSVLLIATSQGSAGEGALLLGVFAFGLSIPFLATALALGKAEKAIARATPYLGAVSRISGVLLVALGLVLATNSETRMIGYLYQLFSFIHYDALLNYM